MTAPRILLAGMEWYGDLLSFCERGLRELGAEVRVLPTNQAPWLGRAVQVRQRLAQLPVAGAGVAGHLALRQRRRLAGEVGQRLGEAVRQWQPDLLLWLLCWGDPITGELMSDLPRLRKVGWLMDDPFQDEGALARALAAFDRVYAVDSAWLEPIRLTTGRPTALLPCGADLDSHRPVPAAQIPVELRSELAFVGKSYHAQAAGIVRRALLEPVADLDLAIFGDPGWAAPGGSDALSRRYRGRTLDSREANRVYNGARIVLNIHHPQFHRGTSLRTFAICASGAFQLVDWRADLEQFLLPDEEVVAYRTPQELREKALHYLADDAARRRIARAGYERVRREHTYAHRLAEILRDADLLPGSGSPAAAPAGSGTIHAG